MTRTAPLLLSLVLGLLAGAVPVRAGSISISLTPQVTLKGDQLVATARITNGGDEAAHAVVPLLRFGDQQVRGQVKDRLEPREVIEPSVSLAVGTLGPGRWPYRLAVDYTDANQYPFQALHAGFVLVGNPPPAKVAVPEMKTDPVAGSGALRVRVKNLGEPTRQVTVLAFVPEGVEATTPSQAITLGAWAEETVTVPLVNRAALPGSRYPVFAIVQYDDEGTHQAVVAQGMLEVTAAQTFVQSNRSWLVGLAAALILGWLAYLMWRLLAGRA